MPSIRGHQPSYRVGEVMKLNCSSYRSYPSVKLHWYVNEEPVSRVRDAGRLDPFSSGLVRVVRRRQSAELSRLLGRRRRLLKADRDWTKHDSIARNC